MFDEFIKSVAGQAVIGVLIAIIAILIIDLNYRLFFKAVLDFLFSLIAVIITSPVLAVVACISKYRAGCVLDKSACLGKGGKLVYIHSFAGIEKSVKNLAQIFDVLAGRMSIVGTKLLSIKDGAVMDDVQMERCAVRPGIFTYLSLGGDEGLTYEMMFNLDRRYAKKRELFYDILIVFSNFAHAVRGDGKSYLGEAAVGGYVETLLSKGEITAEVAEQAEAAAEEAVKEHEKRLRVVRSKYK